MFRDLSRRSEALFLWDTAGVDSRTKPFTSGRLCRGADAWSDLFYDARSATVAAADAYQMLARGLPSIGAVPRAREQWLRFADVMTYLGQLPELAHRTMHALGPERKTLDRIVALFQELVVQTVQAELTNELAHDDAPYPGVVAKRPHYLHLFLREVDLGSVDTNAELQSHADRLVTYLRARDLPFEQRRRHHLKASQTLRYFKRLFVFRDRCCGYEQPKALRIMKTYAVRYLEYFVRCINDPTAEYLPRTRYVDPAYAAAMAQRDRGIEAHYLRMLRDAVSDV
jgi:hypothetical protein